MILCSNQTVRLCWSSAGSTHETRQRLTVFLFISVKQNYSQTISWGLLLIFRLLLLQHVMNLCKNSPEVKTACFSLVFHRELNEIAFIKVVTVWSEQRLVLACGAGGGCDYSLTSFTATSDDSSFHQSSLKPPLYPVSDQIRLTAWWTGASEYFVNLMRN